MSDRKTKLEKTLALIEEPREVAIMAGQQKYLGFILGAEHENARLAPLHAALIEAVEALNSIAQTSESEISGKWVSAYGLVKEAKEALAKLDAVLKSDEPRRGES